MTFITRCGMFARPHNLCPSKTNVSARDDPLTIRDGCSNSRGSHTRPLFTTRHLCEKAYQRVLCIDREWLTRAGLLHSGSRELRGTDRFPRSSIQEMFIGFINSPQVLCKSSLSAALYSFKQAIDKEDISNVKIVTSSRGRGLFQVYQELLFTSAYDFEYSIMFDNLSCECCPPGQCTDSSAAQAADAKRELSTFLQHLPALKGDIAVLRSSLISG